MTVLARRSGKSLAWYGYKFERDSMTTAVSQVPRVSMGVAVYNGERFLSKTLDSLLAQTFKDFELIICDNCSTDATEQICRSYAATDSRIRYHRNSENIGAPRNFNLAASLSLGDYFKWSGADDLCAPLMVEHCVEVLDRRADAVLCYPRTRLIDENDAAVQDYEDRLDIQVESPNWRLAQLLSNIRMCNAVFGLIRSSALKRTRLFGTYPNSDVAFLAELVLHGVFVELPETLFFRRSFELSATKYRSPYERMAMFEPDRVAELSFPNWRLFIGFLSAIHRAPISWIQSLGCYVQLHIWLRRWHAGLSEDVVVAVQYCMRSRFRSDG
jgi:glycosyltransferase involved in cell wall biosynthesis